MGAISMVLDVAVSSKYLVVADRDEKVRIHRYPKVSPLVGAFSRLLLGLRIGSGRTGTHPLRLECRFRWRSTLLCGFVFFSNSAIRTWSVQLILRF